LNQFKDSREKESQEKEKTMASLPILIQKMEQIKRKLRKLNLPLKQNLTLKIVKINYQISQKKKKLKIQRMRAWLVQ
jgi:hypothetical protein